jgi:hypothetical protein
MAQMFVAYQYFLSGAPANFLLSGSLAICNGIRRLSESNEPSEYGAGGRTG